MKSIRLNKDIRAQILTNIKAAYEAENVRPTSSSSDDREESLKKAIEAYYRKVNKDVIAELESKSLMSTFINTSDHICYVNPQGSHKCIYFKDGNGNNLRFPVKTSSGVYINLNNPDTKVPTSIAKVIAHNESLNKTIRKERSAITEYDSKLQAYLQDVRQVLDGVNTSKQLMEVWPEVEKFLPQGITNPSKINLPSVNISSLNSKLGTNK